jgi:hypothetical protein
MKMVGWCNEARIELDQCLRVEKVGRRETNRLKSESWDKQFHEAVRMGEQMQIEKKLAAQKANNQKP